MNTDSSAHHILIVDEVMALLRGCDEFDSTAAGQPSTGTPEIASSTTDHPGR